MSRLCRFSLIMALAAGAWGVAAGAFWLLGIVPELVGLAFVAVLALIFRRFTRDIGWF